MDAPYTTAIVVEAAYSDWSSGSPLCPSCPGSFVRVTGPGIDATMELDADGDVIDTDGVCPAPYALAIAEVAQLALAEATRWAGSRWSTRWSIDTTGVIDEVSDAEAA